MNINKKIFIIALIVTAGLALLLAFMGAKIDKTIQTDTEIKNDKNSGEITEMFKCLPEQRNAEACTADVDPVCATVQIQCIKAPCNPIQETFSNSCNACKNSLVSSYTAGECKQ
ncbi:MAG: hypothetical protein Q8P07_00660 [bacterium]|nr:hypothetical protein [bacterium]